MICIRFQVYIKMAADSIGIKDTFVFSCRFQALLFFFITERDFKCVPSVPIESISSNKSFNFGSCHWPSIISSNQIVCFLYKHSEKRRPFYQYVIVFCVCVFWFKFLVFNCTGNADLLSKNSLKLKILFKFFFIYLFVLILSIFIFFNFHCVFTFAFLFPSLYNKKRTNYFQ